MKLPQREQVEPDACLCTKQQLNTKPTSLPFHWLFYQYSRNVFEFSNNS